MRKLIYVFLAIIVVTLANGKSAAKAASPSFACKATASKVERVICSDPTLAAEDRLMTDLYGLARVGAFGHGISNESAAQAQWLRSRDQACGQSLAEDAAKCVASVYAERNERLALAVLFSHPEIALPQLRRLDPKAAPMLEATYLYAKSRQLRAADRNRIIALLQPYKDAPDLGQPADAVKSDAAFAEFIGTASVSLFDTGSGLAFPCAAMVRRPKLIETTEPRFGSNMDNFIIYSDCEDTLPPLPKFSALVEKRMKGMTDCGGGTIRYAYYRSFWNAALVARLATGSQLRKKPVKPFPHRRNVVTADISAALEELSAFYIRYGRASAGHAGPLARQMIYQMLDEAWQC